MNSDADLFDQLDQLQAEQARHDAFARAVAEWNRTVNEANRQRDVKLHRVAKQPKKEE